MKKTIHLQGYSLDTFAANTKHPYLGLALVSITHGLKFAIKLRRFVSAISDSDSVTVKVVSGLDDICALGCPYYNHCASDGEDESSLGLRGWIMKRISGFYLKEANSAALNYHQLEVGDELPLKKILG